MKRLILMVCVISALTIFFTCSQDPVAPETNQSDQLLTPLAKRGVSYFEGTSVSLLPPIDPGKTTILPNGRTLIRGFVIETDDQLNDTRVSGIVTWIVHLDIYPDGTDKRWGSGELPIPNMGRWDMTYVGWFSLEDGVTYEVDGHGKGEFKGLKAHWTYRKPVGEPAFTVNGYIIESN